MKRLILLLALVLSACATPKQPPARVLHDFGQPMAGPTTAAALRIEAVLPAWLDSTDMSYRLTYDDPSRLRQFAGSRWAGRPSQLIAARLAGHFAPAAARCVLRIEIDEFVQHFSTAAVSTQQLVGRWQITTLNGERLVSGALRESENAGADTAGGVKASIRLVDRLANTLRGEAEKLPACRS